MTDVFLAGLILWLIVGVRFRVTVGEAWYPARMTKQSPDEQRSEAETVRIRDAALKRMLKTPPKPRKSEATKRAR